MATLVKCRCLARVFSSKNIFYTGPAVQVRYSNTVSHKTVEQHRRSKLAHDQEQPDPRLKQEAPRDYKYVFPEFLPNPVWYYRDRIREKLERRDMMRRRAVMDIPEFYVGSIMAVTVADPHSPKKTNRFVGICIQRSGHGLRANFTLRNAIDGQGVEVMYEMYNPSVQRIEVLKLEKRVDDELFYLRDAPIEHSTVPFDMEPVPHPPGANVPVNNIKIQLGPRPWHERWERHNLQGVEIVGLKERLYKRAAEPAIAKPWLKHDLMKEYRETINEEETDTIMREVYDGVKKIERSKGRRKPQIDQR